MAFGCLRFYGPSFIFLLDNTYKIAIFIWMRTTLILDDALLAEAMRQTGRKEKTAVVHLGLKALIERESAKRLARLAGSMPDAAVASRRRTATRDQ